MGGMKRLNLVLVLILITCLFPKTSNAALVNRSTNDRLRTTLVGYWSFDGKDMTRNVMDGNGQGNNGSLQGFAATSTVVIPGASGQALTFDGIDDAIPLSNSSVFNFSSTNNFTISAWVKPGNQCATLVCPIFNKMDVAGTGSYSVNREVTGLVSFYMRDSGGNSDIVVSTTAVSLNKWSHVTVIFRSPNVVDFWIDGVYSGTKFLARTLASVSSTAYIGFQANLNRYFSGAIDEVRVYSSALSTSTVKSLYNLGNSFNVNSSKTNHRTLGLIGQWTFDGPDMTSTLVYDKSGAGLTGTLNSFPSLPRTYPGVRGQALVFDGVDDNVSMGDVADSPTITLAAWVKPSKVSGGMKIISKKMLAPSPEYGIATSLSDPDKFTASFFSSTPSSDVCESTGAAGTYSANKWYFVVATYDGDACKIYVNGTDVTNVLSDLASGDLLNTTSALRIGADGGSSILAGSYFEGAIDDTRIYGRAFTGDEVANLYVQTAGALAANTSRNNRVTNGLVALWSFDGSDMLQNVRDASGQGNHGFMQNFTSTSTGQSPGKIGQGILCDGVDDRIQLSGLTITNTHTISFWIKPVGGVKTFETILNNNGGSTGVFYNGISGKIGYFYSATGHDNTTALPRNKWSHMTIVSNAGNVTFYLNGVADGTASAAIGFTFINMCDDGLSEQFNGVLDDVRIYSRALPATEILQLYNLGR
jgi:hypothetical protein